MTGIVNYECSNGAVSAIAGNGSGLGEEAELTAQKMKVAQMFNTPQQLHSSTLAPIAQNTCYKLAAVNYRKTQIEALNKKN